MNCPTRPSDTPRSDRADDPVDQIDDFSGGSLVVATRALVWILDIPATVEVSHRVTIDHRSQQSFEASDPALVDEFGCFFQRDHTVEYRVGFDHDVLYVASFHGEHE